MTEQEWLVCTDPEAMLEFLRGKATDRKLRLFACACCRHTSLFKEDEWKRIVNHDRRMSATWLGRVSSWLSSKFRPHGRQSGVEAAGAKQEADLARRAVEVAENVADGLAELTELKALFCSPGDDEMEGCYADGPDAAGAAKASAYRASWCARYTSLIAYPPGARFRSPSEIDFDREQSAQGNILRDIFGNPFSPVAVDPGWRTTRVIQRAQMIYDERAFERLPILADDLEQAGCTNADILGHCVTPGEHVRGCWIVDLLLGREQGDANSGL